MTEPTLLVLCYKYHNRHRLNFFCFIKRRRILNPYDVGQESLCIAKNVIYFFKGITSTDKTLPAGLFQRKNAFVYSANQPDPAVKPGDFYAHELD